MATNFFGTHFKITTWGESHGKAIGVVIDGCPPGLLLDSGIINQALAARAPGQKHTSPRSEPDLVEIYSGVFSGQTTGAPISLIIHNKNFDSSKYEPIKDLLRPGHANYTYQKKYGIFDYNGGGRASARETACRVAAAAVANLILNKYQINVDAKLIAIGGQPIASDADIAAILAQDPDNSFGGLVECSIRNLPVGLGEPIYAKIEALLASAMLSIPASKGFEIGSGFKAATMSGFEHNDQFQTDFTTNTNNAGGILAGISNGMPINFKVAFKPTASINHAQNTVDVNGNAQQFILPKGSRHDPCVAIRAVPVVQAMAILVIADLILANQLHKLT